MKAIDKRNLRTKQVKEYQSSGLSLKDWCSLNGLKESQLRYWIYKSNASATKSILPYIHSNNDWIELFPFTNQCNSKSSISLTIGVATVSIDQNFDPEVLSNLVTVLRQTCL